MYFARQIPTGILVIHKHRFTTVQEAEEWNLRTGICLNFTLMFDEEIEEWDGEKIWVPTERNEEDV